MNRDGVVIVNWWYWNTADDLEGLNRDSNETLEMDVVFDNYDDDAWAYDWPCTLCYEGTNWDSNQPSAYADTQIGDNDDERPFSVGSADATDFEPASWYYYMIYDVDGKSDNSTRTKLQSQRGYRLPSGCYSTFCVFSDTTITIITFPNFSSPGGCYWKYPEDTSAPDPCSQW